MPATAPLRHLKECRQRKCNTGEIPHATLRKSICIFEEKVLAKNTIKEAEEAFDKLCKDYHLLREHTDRLEAILREHNIPFPEFWGW